MGVWIETTYLLINSSGRLVTPCMGVWIETIFATSPATEPAVTPCMGVWIETSEAGCRAASIRSHPVWVCGLKLSQQIIDES